MYLNYFAAFRTRQSLKSSRYSSLLSLGILHPNVCLHRAGHLLLIWRKKNVRGKMILPTPTPHQRKKCLTFAKKNRPIPWYLRCRYITTYGNFKTVVLVGSNYFQNLYTERGFRPSHPAASHTYP